MILFELTGRQENNPLYQTLELENSIRLLGFLQSLVAVSLGTQRAILSQTVIKAFNFHAIACLHAYAGEYRPCEVRVGEYTPPEHYRVPSLMEDFVNVVNKFWDQASIFRLAAYVLWQLNYIHPFINGNGRTARACCSLILSLKLGGVTPSVMKLPALLKGNAEYYGALKTADEGYKNGQDSSTFLNPLENLLIRLINS